MQRVRPDTQRGFRLGEKLYSMRDVQQNVCWKAGAPDGAAPEGENTQATDGRTNGVVTLPFGRQESGKTIQIRLRHEIMRHVWLERKT